MLRTMLKSKVHRARVTAAALDYVGSITLDEDLMSAADLLEGEQLAVMDVTNGARLETYAMSGPRGSGVVQINGAAAHLIHEGDIVILLAYALVEDQEANGHRARIIFVDDENRIVPFEAAQQMVEGGRYVARP